MKRTALLMASKVSVLLALVVGAWPPAPQAGNHHHSSQPTVQCGCPRQDAIHFLPHPLQSSRNLNNPS